MSGHLPHPRAPIYHQAVLQVLHVSFSPNGRTHASGSADSTINVWKMSTGAEIKAMTGHENSVSVATRPRYIRLSFRDA